MSTTEETEETPIIVPTCPYCGHVQDRDHRPIVGWKIPSGEWDYDAQASAREVERQREAEYGHIPFYRENAETEWCYACQREGMAVLLSILQHERSVARVRRFLPHTARDLKSLDDYAATDENAAAAVEAVRSKWDGTTNLILYGKPGVGKTTLAALILLEKLTADPGLRAGLVRVDAALASIKRSWDAPGEKEPRFPFGAASIVLVDDLGVERSTDWSRERISGWIYDAYTAHPPTVLVVTTNYSPADLARRLAGNGDLMQGQRLVSRLAGEGAVRLEVKGNDRRMGARGTPRSKKDRGNC